MLVASSWSMMSSFRFEGFLSFASRRLRSRSRRLASRSFFSSSVRGSLSASKTDDSELRRGRRSPRRWGDLEASCGAADFPCSLRALRASSCDRVGRWFGGGPLPPLPGGGTFSRPGAPGGRFIGIFPLSGLGGPRRLGCSVGCGLSSIVRVSY